MSLMRVALSTAMRGSQNALFPSLGTRFPVPGRFSSGRFYSTTTLADKTVCQCGAEIPETKKLINLFRERNLRQLTQEMKCPYFKSFQFTEANDCELVDAIEEISTSLLKEFHDVVRVGDSRAVLLEPLHEIPRGELGDLTGDHGKQMAKFLRFCLEEKYISSIGSVFDVGGQNTSTVKLVSEALGNQNLPSMIVDFNSVTPALCKAQPNIKYVIEDALSFFSSETYQDHVKGTINEKPTLFIFNNMLNVLKAEEGWNTLQAAWKRLRHGDYLVISGLVPEQLEKHGFIKYHEVDGIVEFHHRTKGFYKSALSSSFFEYLVNRLVGSSFLFEETFKFPVESLSARVIEVEGRRLVTFKKE